MQFVRSLRGAFGIGAIWAVPWAAAGALASPIILAFAHAANSIADRVVIAAVIGWYGFLAGLAFSVVLRLMARRRLLSRLTLPRMAAWGTLSSVVLTAPPMIAMLTNRTDGWRPEDPFYLTCGLLLSAGCAVVSLAVARRGANRGDSFVDFGDDAILNSARSTELEAGSSEEADVHVAGNRFAAPPDLIRPR